MVNVRAYFAHKYLFGKVEGRVNSKQFDVNELYRGPEGHGGVAYCRVPSRFLRR